MAFPKFHLINVGQSHSHAGIHPLSFAPMRFSPALWTKWLFALQWWPGYQSPYSFWSNAPSQRDCRWCGCRHNQSVHGHVAFCPPSPLRAAWRSSWPSTANIDAWLNFATARELFLLGKLCIPLSLYSHLAHSGGRRQARAAIRAFHQAVIPALRTALSEHNPLPPLWRPMKGNPFEESDWDTPKTLFPPKKRKALPPPQPKPPKARKPIHTDCGPGLPSLCIGRKAPSHPSVSTFFHRRLAQPQPQPTPANPATAPPTQQALLRGPETPPRG